jgi:hypothetical protein
LLPPEAGRQAISPGLVEPFHLAAGLRVIGPGVITLDPEHAKFDLQSDPALAALFASEDRPLSS